MPHADREARLAYMREYQCRRRSDPAIAERDRVQSRQAKRRRTGTCEKCGAPTRYNGVTVNGPSRLCVICGMEESARLTRARRGTGPMNSAVLAYLSEPRRFMDVVREFGITKGWASGLLHRLLDYGLVRHVERGVWVAAGPEGKPDGD